jgi:hypothetical protein
MTMTRYPIVQQGFLRKAWNSGYPVIRRHYSADGKTALCGRGEMIFYQVAIMTAYRLCKDCRIARIEGVSNA